MGRRLRRVRPRRGRDLTGRYLSLAEREEIALASARGESIRCVARRLPRSPSAVSRELARNSDARGRYRATAAHALAFERAGRPKPAKLARRSAWPPSASSSTTVSPAPMGIDPAREALAACRAGDTLVVTKLGRLGRSPTDARDMVDDLPPRPARLNLGGSVHDPTDAVGRLLFNVLAMVAIRRRPNPRAHGDDGDRG